MIDVTTHVVFQEEPPNAGCQKCVRCFGWIVSGVRQYHGGRGPFCIPCATLDLNDLEEATEHLRSPRAGDP